MVVGRLLRRWGWAFLWSYRWRAPSRTGIRSATSPFGRSAGSSGLRAQRTTFDAGSVTSWRARAVVERTGLAFLVVVGLTLRPAFAVVVAVDSDLRDRAKWSSTGTSAAYPGGPVDLIGVAAILVTVGVAVIGTVILARHLKRRGASSRVTLLAAIVVLVLVLLVDSSLVFAALRSAP